MTDSERYRSGDRIVGKYELVRKLDEGGMGAVWAARNVDLDVHIALKLLRPELAETHAVERLLAEARMLARLQHPAVVRVHDCGRTERGDPFVAMELLDGESLADAMDRRGRISGVEAVSLLLPVVDGVRAAHEAGIVHRDLKPENIYLAQVGGRTQPKVLDFGIALAETIAGRRTTHGAIMGSPVYMSPEQARGSEVGPSTDVWALAVVLYELVTGALPFQGDNYNAVLRAIIEDECPSLTELGAGDQLLAAIVERALAKDPSRRWSSARELGSALAEWLASHGVTEDASHVSLRGWLAYTSEPPASLSPVIVGASDRPPGEGRPTLPAIGTETRARSTLTTGGRAVEGMSLTASQRARGHRKIWALSVAGAVALVAGGAFWLRASHTTSSVASAARALEPAPSASTESREPLEPANAPAPPSLADAGPSAEPAAQPAKPRPHHEPRPPAREPKSGYRPRGI